jgi:broad specificity phosphatase PhoE
MSNLSAWQRFDKFVQSLVAAASDGVSYKVLYMGRHGQGFHNVAESSYGTKAWDDYWSKLEGNGTVIWADAHLTEVGEEQVLQAHEFIASQLSDKMMPAPEAYYVSPLYRCLQTANLTYAGLQLPVDRPFKPIIKELLREDLGEHTCDRRSSRTVIHRAFPEWRFESGFSEHDLLWRADYRETDEEHDVRTRAFMNELFSNDRSTYISLTSHSGAIASKLRVLGHRVFTLPTGGMIPVLVKATRREAS